MAEHRLTIKVEDGDAGVLMAALLGYRMQMQSLSPEEYQAIAQVYGGLTEGVCGDRQVMPSQEVMIHRIDELADVIMEARRP